MPTNPAPRKRNARHIADQGVTLPTKTSIPVCTFDDVFNRRLNDGQQTFASGGASMLASVLVRSAERRPVRLPPGRAVRRPRSSATSPPSPSPSPAAATPGTPSPADTNGTTPRADGGPTMVDHLSEPARSEVTPREFGRSTAASRHVTKHPRTRAERKPSAGRYCAATVISRSIAHRCQLA